MGRIWGKAPATCRCNPPSAEQAWRQGLKDGDTWHCGTPGCGRTWTLNVVKQVGKPADGHLYTLVGWRE